MATPSTRRSSFQPPIQNVDAEVSFQDLVTSLVEEHDKVCQENETLRAELQRWQGEHNSSRRRRASTTAFQALQASSMSPPTSPKMPSGATEDWIPRCHSGETVGTNWVSATGAETVDLSNGQKGPAARFRLKKEWRLENNNSATMGWGNDMDSSSFGQLQLGDENTGRIVGDRNQQSPTGNTRTCYIHPSSTARFNWDICGLVLITYDLITIPMMVFDMPDSTFSHTMDWLTLSFWTGDMLQSFFLAYYDRGQLITSRQLIWKRYLRTWFFVDSLVVVPEWVMNGLDAGAAGNLVGLGRVLRAARAVRMLRLLRLLKLQRIMNTVYDMIDSEYTFIVLDLCRLLVFILVLNHVVACGWYLVGRLTRDAGMSNWLEDAGAIPVAGTNLGWEYTTSLHWSLTQFTPGSMDVSARNIPERIFSVVVHFFALVAFGTIVGSITGSMTALRNMRGDEVKQFWMLRRFLKQKKINGDLKDRIVKYLEHREEQKQNQVQESAVKVLLGLSQPLRNEMTCDMYMPSFEPHPFFKYLGEALPYVMFRVCTEVTETFCYARDDVVFYHGDEAAHLYFVKEGWFDFEMDVVGSVLSTGTEQLCVRVTSRARNWLSEAALWVKWSHRGKCKASREGDLLAVKPAQFAKVLSIHPRPWFFARNYGLFFVNLLNDRSGHGLTDITIFQELVDDEAGYTEEVKDCDTWGDHQENGVMRSDSKATYGVISEGIRGGQRLDHGQSLSLTEFTTQAAAHPVFDLRAQRSRSSLFKSEDANEPHCSI